MTRHALLFATLAVAGCTNQKEVKLTFGETGEGLDGFICKDSEGDAGVYLLDRLAIADGGVLKACLVTDFVVLGGTPDGCRPSQLIKWCKDHPCAPAPTTRLVTDIELPSHVTGLSRAEVRGLVLKKMKALQGQRLVSDDAPNEPVILRVMATAQPCYQVEEPASGVLPEFDPKRLIGCSYSCPTEFDKVGQDVFLSFDTLENACDHGVRTCTSNMLTWAP